jgi:flagellar biosynthesis protein FlhB
MADQNDSSAEKSEEPTQKRLDKAKEDGQSVRSKELDTTAMLLAGSSGLLLTGPDIATSLANVMRVNFSLSPIGLDESTMLSNLGHSLADALTACLPFFAALVTVSVLTPAVLGGWNLTFKAITPKASRMNPMSGLGRMFGPKALLELGKAVSKVLVVGSFAALIIFLNMDALLTLHHQSPIDAMQHAISLVGWAFLFMAAAMILITAIDIPIQLFQHSQKLRMTLQQVKDEMKDSDGRPEIKQKIRQLQQQMASNRMMQDVPMADVVITNPEHYSVALRYDQSIDAAPIVLAKGADLVAMKIREIATENEIPIVSAPPLARAVYFNTDIGGEIPSGLYVAVA